MDKREYKPDRRDRACLMNRDNQSDRKRTGQRGETTNEIEETVRKEMLGRVPSNRQGLEKERFLFLTQYKTRNYWKPTFGR